MLQIRTDDQFEIFLEILSNIKNSYKKLQTNLYKQTS